MKTRIWIPGILLALCLSSFDPNSKRTGKTSFNNDTITNTEYCSMYGIGSLVKNGETVPLDPTKYLLYFCSGNVFAVNTSSYTAEGTWIDNGKNITISVTVPDPDMEWVDGEWQVLERSDWALEMERTENGDTWRVRLEGRQR